MTDIKISLTIELPGSTMVSRTDALKTVKVKKRNKNGKPILDKNGNPIIVEQIVEDYSKNDYHELRITDDKGKLSDIVGYFTRKCKPAYQAINLSREAYEYFISKEKPFNFRTDENKHPERVWKQMTEIQRLEWHLNTYAEAMGGILIDYKVFDD